MEDDKILDINETNNGYTGNIDLNNRSVVFNDDGSMSTERSITIEEDGDFINIPTVVGGKIVSDEEAINSYHSTGLHLGKHKTKEEAIKSAEKIHQQQAEKYIDLTPNILEEMNAYSDYGASKYKIEDYMRETKERVPDYEGIYNSTIHDTGTSLDGKDYDEVAEAKQTTPKKIFELSDCLSQIYEGFRSFSANVFDIGGELASAIADPYFHAYENITGEKAQEKLTEEEKQELNPFGSKERKEARSSVGEFAGAGTQLLLGFKTLKPLFPAGPETLVDATKMQLFKQGFFDLLRLGASEGISFSENQQNFSEFIKNSFGLTPSEFLVKKEDDPYFQKRFKNAADASGYGFIIGSLFKLGKVLYGTAPVQATKTGVKKVVGTITKPIGKVVNPAAEKMLRKVDPIGTIAKKELEQESTAEVAELTKEQIIEKTTKEGTKKVVKKIVEHPKTLTEDEINDVLKQAKKRGMIDEETLKNANKTVLEDVARSLIDLQKKAIKTKRKALELRSAFESGEITDQQYTKEVMKLFDGLGEKAAREKTAESIPGYAEYLASQDERVRAWNKIVKWFGENQDVVDSQKIGLALENIDNAETLSALLDVGNEIVKRGRTTDFVGKFTQIMQNVYLASISGRVQDAIGSLVNYSLQVLDAGTAGVVGGTKQAIRNTAAKVGLTTAKTETDRVFMNEAFNMLSGMFELAKESIVFNSKKLLRMPADGISPYKKARLQAIASKQSRFGKKYGEITLFNSDSPVAVLANKIFNHGGIWASEQVDDFIETFAYRGHLKRSVYHNVQVEGIKKGWTSEQIAKEAKKRFKETIEHQFDPRDLEEYSRMGTKEGAMSATINRARQAAEETTFRSELKTPFAKWLYKTANSDVVKPYFRILYPFQKVGLKIAVDDYLRDRTITTLFRPRFWRDIMAGGSRQDQALAKLANGIAIQAALWGLYKEGKITGPTPKNRNKAKMFHDAGWKEFSVYDENKGEYIQAGNWMGPYEVPFRTITSLLSSMDDINERIEERAGDDWTNHLLELPTLFAESAVSTAFVGQLIDNIDRGDTLGIRTFANSMSRFGIPALKEFNELFSDGYKQTTLTKLDSFASQWGIGPYHFGETYEDLDLFGEPLWADSRYLYVGPKKSKREYDPVIEEMLNKQAYVQVPSSNISEFGGKVYLERDEVYEWQAIMGEIKTRKAMQDLIKSQAYKLAVDHDNDKYGRKSKRALLVSEYNKQKRKAFDILLNRNTIVRKKLEDAEYRSRQPVPDERFQPYVPSLKIGE